MKILRCSLSYCDKRLNTAKEVATGLCGRHLDELANPRNYVGVCWNCSRITLIDEPHRRLKPVWGKVKYLFTKACAECTGERKDDIAWITWERFNPAPSWVITEKGKLQRVVPATKITQSQLSH